MPIYYPQVTHQLSGNTAGTTEYISAGTYLLNAGANITLSQDSNTVTIIGGAGGGGGSFSAGISNLGNTRGQSGLVSNNLVLAGGDFITLSQATNTNGATITFDAAPTLSAGISTAGNTAGTTGVVSNRLIFVGSGPVSLSQSLNGASATITINNRAFSIGVSTAGNTAGSTGVTQNTARYVFAGGNNITVSQSTGAGLATLSIVGNDPFTGGVSNLGNTSGTTGTVSNNIIYVGGNNITLSQSSAAGGATITISGATTFPAFSAGISNLGNTAGTSSMLSNRIVFAGGNNITLSQSTGTNGATITVSAANTTSTPAFSIGMSTNGNTSGTTGTFSNQYLLMGGNNITLSQNTATSGASLTISGPNMLSVGVSNLGNTAGNTGVRSDRIVLVGSNNITLSQTTGAAGATISIFGASGGGGGGAFTAGMSTNGSTGGTTGLVSNQLVFVGSQGIQLSQSVNGQSATLSLQNIPYQLSFSPFPFEASTLQAYSNRIMSLHPFRIDCPMSAIRAMIFGSLSYATTNPTSSFSAALTMRAGIYTRNDSVLSLASSGSRSHVYSDLAGVNSALYIDGIKRFPINLTANLTPGDYWLALWIQSTVSGSFSYVAHSGMSQTFGNDFGYSPSSTAQIRPGWGYYPNTFSSALPSLVSVEDLNGDILYSPLYVLHVTTIQAVTAITSWG